MFLESTNGLHVEDLCVYNSAARPDHILDLRTHSSDAADLICHIKYGSAVLQYGRYAAFHRYAHSISSARLSLPAFLPEGVGVYLGLLSVVSRRTDEFLPSGIVI